MHIQSTHSHTATHCNTHINTHQHTTTHSHTATHCNTHINTHQHTTTHSAYLKDMLSFSFPTHTYLSLALPLSLSVALSRSLSLALSASIMAQNLEIVSKTIQLSTRRTRILMGFIIYYLVLTVNPMGRILICWKRCRKYLEILCHPICNRLWCKVKVLYHSSARDVARGIPWRGSRGTHTHTYSQCQRCVSRKPG